MPTAWVPPTVNPAARPASARINAALHEAETRRVVEDILDAAAAYLEPSSTVAGDELQDASERDAPMESERRIFLSHASADKRIAELLKNALVLGGVPQRRIFYSSARATGIPSGEDVVGALRHRLQHAGLVIELISETFLRRPMCLIELGGAWALELPTYPIVVPPLLRATAVTEIGNVQMGVLGSDVEIDDVFDELHDRVENDVGIRTKTTEWNQAVRDFRPQLAAHLASIEPTAGSSEVQPVQPTSASDTAELMTISNASIVAGSRGKELHAEAANRDSVQHSATIRATFYAAEGNIVDTARTVVNQVQPGKTKTLSMRNVPEHSRFKIEVDTLL